MTNIQTSIYQLVKVGKLITFNPFPARLPELRKGPGGADKTAKCCDSYGIHVCGGIAWVKLRFTNKPIA